MSIKLCSICKTEKPLHEFHNSKKNRDGKEGFCKRCRLDISNRNRANNRAHYNSYFRKYQSTKKWREYLASYYQRNKKRLLESARNRPGYLAQKNIRWHRRRARLQGNGGTHSQAEWLDLLRLYGFSCAYCRATTKLSKDHMTPLSKGGIDDISNIQPLCQSCNSKKGSALWLALNTKV